MDLIINVSLRKHRGEPVEAIGDFRITDIYAKMPEEVEMEALGKFGPVVNQAYYRLGILEPGEED